LCHLIYHRTMPWAFCSSHPNATQTTTATRSF
jgi:hypothetical protein